MSETVVGSNNERRGRSEGERGKEIEIHATHCVNFSAVTTSSGYALR